MVVVVLPGIARDDLEWQHHPSAVPQPFHVLLELQEQGCRCLGACATYKVTPLSDTPGNPWKTEAGKGHPLTSQ